MSVSNSSGALCFCNSNLVWGGGEHWHLQAALAMAEKGLRVIILADGRGELFSRARKYSAITVLPCRFSNLSWLNPVSVYKLVFLFRKHQVARVICGLPKDLKAAAPAAKIAGVSRILYRRGSALPVRGSWLNRYLYGRILDGVIVNSRATERLLLQDCPDLIAKDHIRLLSNGLDVEAFDSQLAGSSPLFSEDPALPVLGSAGRLSIEKGQKYLPHLSRALLDAGFAHRLVLAGSGELEAELKQLAERLGVTEQVFFTGFLQEMGPFWNSVDFFVLPSLREGFGFVLAEAMLARKPLLAFEVSSMPELVRPGLNGELIPPPAPGEPDEEIGKRLAAVVMAMFRDKQKLAAYGRSGRAQVLAEYDQRVCMDKLYEIIMGLRPKPHRGAAPDPQGD